VYAIGGLDGETFMCSGEKYNATTGTWTQIPHMRKHRSKFGIEVNDDKIFAIGGYIRATTRHEIEYYDEKYNEWFEASTMNACRRALSACVVTGVPNVRDYIHKEGIDPGRSTRRILAVEAEIVRGVEELELN
jgi:kelch-like protein 10